MKRSVEIGTEDRHFIVVFDQADGSALVKERVLIHDGPRRKYYDEKIRWVDIPEHPPLIPNPLYERVIQEARSKL